MDAYKVAMDIHHEMEKIAKPGWPVLTFTITLLNLQREQDWKTTLLERKRTKHLSSVMESVWRLTNFLSSPKDLLNP